MDERFSRTELLLGKGAMKKLYAARVIVFGIGGVGGYVCEALARSGVGSLSLVDSDRVCITNINRQIIADEDSVGRLKVDVMKERMLKINPHADVKTYPIFFGAENKDEFDFSKYDYVVDAIDTVSAKIEIVKCAKAVCTPIISSMGAGNKTDATAFEVADIYKTSVCPLAKVVRRLCRENNIDSLKTVYSKEEPRNTECESTLGEIKTAEGAPRKISGSCAFVPPAVGLIIAGEVVKDLIG